MHCKTDGTMSKKTVKNDRNLAPQMFAQYQELPHSLKCAMVAVRDSWDVAEGGAQIIEAPSTALAMFIPEAGQVWVEFMVKDLAVAFDENAKPIGKLTSMVAHLDPLVGKLSERSEDGGMDSMAMEFALIVKTAQSMGRKDGYCLTVIWLLSFIFYLC
jgi:hypothetical protein